MHLSSSTPVPHHESSLLTTVPILASAEARGQPSHGQRAIRSPVTSQTQACWSPKHRQPAHQESRPWPSPRGHLAALGGRGYRKPEARARPSVPLFCKGTQNTDIPQPLDPGHSALRQSGGHPEQPRALSLSPATGLALGAQPVASSAFYPKGMRGRPGVCWAKRPLLIHVQPQPGGMTLTLPGHGIFAKTRSSCVRVDPRSSDFLRGNLDTGTRGRAVSCRNTENGPEPPGTGRAWDSLPQGLQWGPTLPAPGASLLHPHATTATVRQAQEAKAAGPAVGPRHLHSKLWLCWRTGKKGP